MTHRFFFQRSAWISTAFCVILTGIARADEKKSTTASEGGPLLIALAPAKPESAKYDLKYKLKRGEVLRYEVTDRASFNTTIEESSQAAQTKTVTVKAWKITDVLPNGDIEFNNVVERVQMVNHLPDRDPIEYDSGRDKTPPAGFEDVAKSINVPLIEVTMTPRGKLLRRDWKLRTPSGDESSPIALRLPDKPASIGDTWDEPFDLKVALESGEMKSIQTRRHHKLAKVTNGIATIEVTFQVLSPIDSYAEYQLVQRLMEGEVRFDIKRGRVVSQKMDIDKRIIGFAGPTSSTHYLWRMEEKLLKPGTKVAAKPSGKTRSASRQRSQQKSRKLRQ